MTFGEKLHHYSYMDTKQRYSDSKLPPPDPLSTWAPRHLLQEITKEIHSVISQLLYNDCNVSGSRAQKSGKNQTVKEIRIYEENWKIFNEFEWMCSSFLPKLLAMTHALPNRDYCVYYHNVPKVGTCCTQASHLGTFPHSLVSS